jgi:predicted ABC-type ATPase
VVKGLGDAATEHLTNADQHTVDGNREHWTAERNKIHAAIVAEAYDLASDVPCDRQAIIAGGLGGAGKTTVLERYAGIDLSQYIMINPDNFKEKLAERGLTREIPGLSPMEATTLAHEESSDIARLLALWAMADGKNLIWDITMSSEKSSGRVDELRSAGYEHIKGIFVDIPIEASIARSEARHRRGHDLYLTGDGLGGRYVPPEVIRGQWDEDFGTKNRKTFEMIKDRFKVAERFRHRSWPHRVRARPSSYLEMAAAEQEDPDPYIPGSYDDVVVAHSRGRLTDSEYETLVDAIAEARRAEETKDGERG